MEFKYGPTVAFWPGHQHGGSSLRQSGEFPPLVNCIVEAKLEAKLDKSTEILYKFVSIIRNFGNETIFS